MINYKKGMHPGAVWKRTDLQIHTPRDPQWSGSAHLAGGTADAEAARDSWAKDFVEACVKRGLKAIAVTDHHDFCFVEYVQRAIAKLPDDLERPWLFPGVEVTCRDSVQCLVIFDQTANPLSWHRLFGGHLQNVAAPNADLPTNPQAVECGKDIEPFIEGMTSDTALKGISIVLPHASNENAHKSMIRQGFAPRFKSLPFEGVYSDKAYQAIDPVTKKKIYGQIPEWGLRRRGIIPTGDNRHQDFRNLGKHECWIRLGEPTAEAIRQAVLADSARIAYQPPTLPSHRILEVHVASTLTGNDFAISFNDGFTALIGGRGSGKSAVLEYLRFGLGRGAGDTDMDGDERRSRDQQMIADTLQNGFVRVTLERDGVVETWKRDRHNQEQIVVQVEGGPAEMLTIAAAQQRFRARAFYQRQLSTLVSDAGRAAEQITGIAAAEFVDQRRALEKAILAAKREVHNTFQQVVEFWVAESEYAQGAAAVADIKRRIEAVKTRMEEAGLSPEHQALLDSAPSYRLVASLADEAEANVVADLATIRRQLSGLSSLQTEHWRDPSQRFPELKEFVSVALEAKENVEAAMRAAAEAIEALQSKQGKIFQAFAIKRANFDAAHTAAVAQQVATKTLAEESERLNIELQAAASVERRSQVRVEQLRGAPLALTAARLQLSDKVSELDGVLVLAAGQVQEMSENSLRARVVNEEIAKQALAAIMSICDGNRIRDVQIRCEDRLRNISVAKWREVVDGTISILKHKVQNSAPTIDGSETIGKLVQETFLGEVTPQQLSLIYEKIDSTTAANMLSAVAESFISFDYLDGKSYISFVQASPGQQASALLNLLLNQEAGTLLIDQPEDDLDNRIVMKIATLLQTTKRKRQLIFATHNPNFVVNGDADKIVVLRPGHSEGEESSPSARITIETDGAIETASVRSQVTETMEGGQAAFELRSRKYSFPLVR